MERPSKDPGELLAGLDIDREKVDKTIGDAERIAEKAAENPGEE